MRTDLVEQAKAIKAVQDKLAQRFEEINSLLQSITDHSSLIELLAIFRKIREKLKDC